MNTSRRVRLLAPCFGLFAALVGCAPQPAANADHASVAKEKAVVVIAPQPVSAPQKDDPKPRPPAPPPPPPPTFKFTPDLTGQALAKVVAPDLSPRFATEWFGKAPRPRPIPAHIAEPSAIGRGSYALPPLITAHRSALKPASPPEKVPHDLGLGADDTPGKPVLLVAAVDTPRARDVNLPPPAPTLGRPVPTRVPFDDPTSDLGNDAVVTSSVKTPLAPSGFLKAVIPDPFELGTQVKPKVPATAEPSAAPVPVNPQRVK